MRNAPSLRALKLMHLMISTAGGRMADDTRHEIRLSEIRRIQGMAHHDRQSLTPLFEEAAKSNHWAILDRQTVFHLGSKYSVLLFQHIASLTGLSHVTSKTFTVPELRALLGVTEGKLSRFSNLKQIALGPAIAEINHLSRMTLTATSRKIGRTVASVEITWEVKPDPTEAKRELNRPKTGRKPRRNGTAETPVAAFPASGGIRYAEPFGTLAKTHGNGKDIDLIANDFRAWAKGKFALDSKGVAKKFEAFCKGVKL